MRTGTKTIMRKRRLSAIVFVAILTMNGCSDAVFEPPVDCSAALGAIFVELAPPVSGVFADYTIDVGDSIQVTASLRRVDGSAPVFNPQQGWSCRITSSSAVAGAVMLSTADTLLVRLHASGWMRGLRAGLAIVTASSASPAAHREIGVLVRSP